MNKNTKEMLDYNLGVESKVLDALSPVMNFFNNLSFGYTRYYFDEKRIILETNTKWLKAHIQNGFYDETLSECFSNIITSTSDQYVHLITGEPQNPVHSLLFDHNMWNGLCIFMKTKNYIEVFHFESSVDNDEVVKLYVSQPGVFYKMVSFIREKLNDIKIERSPRVPFSPNSVDHEIPEAKSPSVLMNRDAIESFSDRIEVRKVYLPLYDVYLTKKQASCYSLIARGFSSKEIGRMLGISPRTVESYTDNIKEKLGIKFKNEIILNEYISKNNGF